MKTQHQILRHTWHGLIRPGFEAGGNRRLEFDRLGCPGEALDSMINSGSCLYFAGSQLNAAIEFLNDNGANVHLVTIDIGGNDFRNAGCSGADACDAIRTGSGSFQRRTGRNLRYGRHSDGGCLCRVRVGRFRQHGAINFAAAKRHASCQCCEYLYVHLHVRYRGRTRYPCDYGWLRTDSRGDGVHIALTGFPQGGRVGTDPTRNSVISYSVPSTDGPPVLQPIRLEACKSVSGFQGSRGRPQKPAG